MKTKRILLFALAIALTGCAARVKNVTNLPAGVTLKQVQDWDAAVANLHKIATTTSTLRQTVIALNKSGVYGDSNAYVAMLQGTAKVDQIQIDAANYLEQTPKTFGETQKAKLRDYMTQIGQAIDALNTQGVIGIKNLASQKQVSQLIAEITGVINLVLTLSQ